MAIIKEYFGETKDGKEVYKYTLQNEKLEVSLISYGAAIQSIKSPGKDGKFENVVLGYEDLKGYEANDYYFGVTVGRVAGRIAGAEFQLNGETYKLAANNGRNSLHGGPEGFWNKVWNAGEIKSEDADIIEFFLKSPHLEEGFPGEIEMVVRYILRGDTLTVEYCGNSDRDTILNLTNHSYFNLSGNKKEDIFSHTLQIDSEKYLEVDSENIPSEIKMVESTLFDFRKEKQITDGHYDNPFILEDSRKMIYSHPVSGRTLEVVTDQPAVVVYAGWFLPERNMGLCLETQDYPNAVNDARFKTKIYGPRRPYTQKTSYKFYSR